MHPSRENEIFPSGGGDEENSEELDARQESNPREESERGAEKESEEGSESGAERKKYLKEKAVEMYQALQGRINGALEKFFPKYAERNQQKILQERLLDMLKNNSHRELIYPTRQGVVATASKRAKNTPELRRMQAKGMQQEEFIPPDVIWAQRFIDCCGVVLQSPDGVGVVHISPYVLEEEEGRPANVGVVTDSRNQTWRETIMETSRVLYTENEDLEETYSNLTFEADGSRGRFFDPTDLGRIDQKMQKTERKELTEEQMAEMEKTLKVTIFGGDTNLLENIRRLFQKERGSDLPEEPKRFPDIIPSEFNFGKNQKDVYASKDEILLVTKNMVIGILGNYNFEDKIFNLSTHDDDAES